MRGPVMNIRCTNRLTQPHPVTTPILCFKQVLLSKSFQKFPPKKTCGKCGCSHNHGEFPAFGTTCSGCGKKTIGSNRVEAPGGGTVHQDIHPATATEAKKNIQQAVQARQGMGRRTQEEQQEDYSQEVRKLGKVTQSLGKFTARTITPSQSEIF